MSDPAAPGPSASVYGLRRRLMVMLFVPLAFFTALNAWFDWRQAGTAAQELDQQLLRMAPLLVDSIAFTGNGTHDPPIILLAPPIEEFMQSRAGVAAFRFSLSDGRLLAGADWLPARVPAGGEPELYSLTEDGRAWRVVTQLVATPSGLFIAQLADASDTRQHWLRSLLLKVLLPNLALMGIAALLLNFAVGQALRPLTELTDVVRRRSPRDLSAIATDGSPLEVRPLVEALNRLFDLVNAQAEAQRRFIADAAHQLRTPLAGLQAQVEAWSQAARAARAAGGDGQVHLRGEQIDRLRSATRRTSQLANQLLALSRADAQTMSAQPMQQVDLKELCEAVLASHLDAALGRRIDLGLEAEPAWTLGHEWLLRELLGNLVDNAIKYIPDGGSVTIRCGPLAPGPDGADATAAAARVALEVEDNGPGIPADEQARVLERFYRVPGTVGEGNGLGLAIADEIARVHGSRLQLDRGAQGRGLRVLLVLGAVRESAAT